jgi:hypothetical protein
VVDLADLLVVQVDGDQETVRRYLRYASAFAGGHENYSWTWRPGGAVFGFRTEAAQRAFQTLVSMRAAS